MYYLIDKTVDNKNKPANLEKVGNLSGSLYIFANIKKPGNMFSIAV